MNDLVQVWSWYVLVANVLLSTSAYKHKLLRKNEHNILY